MPEDNVNPPDDETEETSDNQNEDSSEEDVEESEETSEAKDKSSDSELDQFINPKDVPPQLKEVHKRMIAGYTKSLNKVRSEAKQLEEQLGTRFSQHVVKSKALDALSENPNFQLFYADLENNKPYGHSSVFNRTNGKENRDDNDDDADIETKSDSPKLSAAAIAKIVQAEVSRALKPFNDGKAKEAFDDARKTLKNFDKLRPNITAILQENPNMSLKRAHKLALAEYLEENEDDVTPEDEADVRRLKKKPRSERSSTGKTDTLAPKAAQSIREAIDFALEKQR